MKTFVRIFRRDTSEKIEVSIFQYAKQMSCDIVSASTTINQGVFYTTVVFSEKPKARASAKKEVE